MIRELDCVALKSDLPRYGLAQGTIGAVVFVYGDEQAFEVEFVSETGETIALVTLNPDEIVLSNPAAGLELDLAGTTPSEPTSKVEHSSRTMQHDVAKTAP